MKKRIYYLGAAICSLSLLGSSIHAQWNLQTTLADRPPLLSVKAVSKDIAWTCSGLGTVYRTTDGGKTWNPTSAISNEALGCIEALDANTAFVGGEGPGYSGGDAKIYRTTDGGQSWRVVYTAIGKETAWSAIQFFDSQNGIAISDAPVNGGTFVIVKTTDGGTTWTPVPNPPMTTSSEEGNALNCSHFYDSLNGWFGTVPSFSDPSGFTGRIFRTTNGGITWQSYLSGNEGPLVGLRFISPLVGICACFSEPFVTRTEDGGQTWTKVTDLPVSNIARMYTAAGFITPDFKQLWISGNTITPFAQFILSSVDSGKTWQQQEIAGKVEHSIFHISAVIFGAMSDSVQAWGVTIDQNTWTSGGEILSYRQRIGSVTRVKEQANFPTEYALAQNYPNPFNPSTTIRYSLGHADHVSLKIFNLAGEEITTLVDGKHNAGEHQIQWHALGVPNGGYFYHLQAGDHVETRKMILLR